jgi:hypothetical protein
LHAMADACWFGHVVSKGDVLHPDEVIVPWTVFAKDNLVALAR